MLGLPKSTEVKRPLPKAQLYKRFDWNPSQRESFDADISRLDFVNWLTPGTLPAIAEGNEVKEIFVIEVSLKSSDFDIKNIILLARSIPQCIVYALRYENEVRLAVFHTKLFVSDWQSLNAIFSSLILSSLNLDVVWQKIVTAIGQFTVEQENSLSLQIKVDEERDKLRRQIAVLEYRINATKQPRQKRQLFLELQKLKQQNNTHG